MFGKRIRLFSLFGFAVNIDLSWIIIAVLITWSLAAGLFPARFRGLSTATYVIMGIIGALGLFISIVLHEMSHSLVARRFGMPMKGITLFLFGGVAEMSEEPPSAKAEFLMAGAGPLSSVIISGFFFGLTGLGRAGGWPAPVIGILAYLAFINLLLAGFNLIPAFPLDGGRVLRSIIWGTKKNLRAATRVSSRIGVGFGVALIVLGVFSFITGNFIAGMWWFLIGLFLQSAARASYQQLVTREALEGEPVSRFMTRDPVTVPASASIRELVEDYVYRYHFKLYPVTEDGDRLVGCVTTRQVREMPRENWDTRTVGESLVSCTPDNTVHPDTDAVRALSIMSRTGASRLLVTEGDRLVGVISLKDLLRFLSLKVELGD